MNNDDDERMSTMDELFETAQALLGWSDSQRALADAKPTEALELRLSAAESEAEGLVVLRELVTLWAGPPKPDPGRPAQRPDPPASNADAVVRLQQISERTNLALSRQHPHKPLRGSSHSPSEREPSATRPAAAEAPTAADEALRACGAPIHGRPASLYQFERPLEKAA